MNIYKTPKLDNYKEEVSMIVNKTELINSKYSNIQKILSNDDKIIGLTYNKIISNLEKTFKNYRELLEPIFKISNSRDNIEIPLSWEAGRQGCLILSPKNFAFYFGLSRNPKYKIRDIKISEKNGIEYIDNKGNSVYSVDADNFKEIKEGLIKDYPKIISKFEYEFNMAFEGICNYLKNENKEKQDYINIYSPILDEISQEINLDETIDIEK